MGTTLIFLSELFFPLLLHACQWPDPKPNRHPFTYIALLVRLSGWGRQTNFLFSTIMQSNKGVWCQVAGQPARRICRTVLELLERQCVTPPVAISGAVCWSWATLQSILTLKSVDNWLFFFFFNSKDFFQNQFFDVNFVVVSLILRAFQQISI